MPVLSTLPSPNCNARPAGVRIDTIVLHADAHPDASEQGERVVIGWLANPDAKVSYHRYVRRNGDVVALVPFAKRAWACGVSEYEGRTNVNHFSVSLSFANRNDGEPYTEPALASMASLCAGLVMAYPAIRRPDGHLAITTHAIVSPGRKTDPRGLDLPAFLARVEASLTAGGPFL